MTKAIDPVHGEWRIRDVLHLLEGDVARVSGPVETRIESIAPLGSVRAGALTFCRYSDGRLDQAVRCAAAAVIVPADVQVEAASPGPTLIAVANPRLAFIKVAARLFDRTSAAGVHPTAVIDPTASIDPAASIGAFVVVGPRCSVGARSMLAAHVVLQQDVRIGADSRIDAGTVIGAEGFGFERDAGGELVDFPHLGGVRIGNGVDIGCNVCIDRGTLEDTIIEDGARIDNLTHISHNCRIGAHAVVVCEASICGSAKIGNYAWVSPSAAVLNQVSVGERAHVGMGAVVIRDVADGEVVVGNPARPLAARRKEPG